MAEPRQRAASDHGILAIWHDCAPGREAEFEAWYQQEHLIERLAVPGFLFGRRLEAVSGAPRYFTFYVTQSPTTLTSAAYLARLDDPTPATKTMMTGVFQNMSRTICCRDARAGHFRGAVTVAARFDDFPDPAEGEAWLATYPRDPAVARVELWRAHEPGDTPVAEEERLRGGDAKIGGCLIVETLTSHTAEAIAAGLSRQFPAAETGVYRTLCEIGNGAV
jgi:hypothetical protein